MASHKHGGNNPHGRGETDPFCPLPGRITYCGPDPDDVYDPMYYCEHEDRPSAAGGPLNDPPGSVVGRTGEPGDWSPFTRIPGQNPGMLKWRLISDQYISRTPFDAANIPCNPDQPGSLTRSRTETVSCRASASVKAEVARVISAQIGVDITVSVTVTLSETVFGERCRSVDYRWYHRFKLYEIVYFPPDSNQGRTLLRLFVPLPSPWRTKEYVAPTCCVRRTAALYDRVGKYLAGAEGNLAAALTAAQDHLLVARLALVDPGSHGEALSAYADAVAAVEAAGSDAPLAGLAREAAGVLAEIATATVKDAAMLREQAGSAGIVSAHADQLLRDAHESLGRTAGTSAAAAARHLAAAYRQAIGAMAILARGAVAIDPRSMGVVLGRRRPERTKDRQKTRRRKR